MQLQIPRQQHWVHALSGLNAISSTHCATDSVSYALCVIRPPVLPPYLSSAMQQNSALWWTHLSHCSTLLVSLWTRKARISRLVNGLPLSCRSHSQLTWLCLKHARKGQKGEQDVASMLTIGCYCGSSLPALNTYLCPKIHRSQPHHSSAALLAAGRTWSVSARAEENSQVTDSTAPGGGEDRSVTKGGWTHSTELVSLILW